MQARAWTFTLNNYNDHGWSNWQDKIKQLEPFIEYCIVEEEVGEQGTPHLQGYLRFKNARRFTTLQRFFEGYAHIEKAIGDDLDSKKYCSKDNNNVLEIGTPHKKALSKKLNWDELITDFGTMDIKDFVRFHPKEAVLHYNKIQLLSSAMHQEEEQTQYNSKLTIKNYWIYGAPGTGKSRWARQQTPSIYLKPVNKWWSGYNFKYQMVLMEDFPCYEQTKGALAQHMKLWSDRYTFTAETKGGHMFVHPKDYVFVVTSNYSIEQCFSTDDAEAIKRRFNEILVVKNDIFFDMELEVFDILKDKNFDEEQILHAQKVRQ